MRVLVFAVAALALTGAQIRAGAASPLNTNQVRARGCVQAGVEAGCLVVKDIDNGKLYNLLIMGAKPDIGIGIEFTGVPFEGMTACMQGVPVQVTTWTRKDSLKCTKGKAKSE
jgi:hypothetical protein